MRMTLIPQLLCVALLTACATATWNDDTVAELRKGMTKTELVALLGGPTSQSRTADGETLLFKRPADNSGLNTITAIGSFGIFTGKNASIVDALRVELKNDVVTNYEFMENVNTYTMQ